MISSAYPRIRKKSVKESLQNQNRGRAEVPVPRREQQEQSRGLLEEPEPSVGRTETDRNALVGRAERRQPPDRGHLRLLRRGEPLRSRKSSLFQEPLGLVSA